MTLALALALVNTPAAAQDALPQEGEDAPPAEDSPSKEELARHIDVLAAELERLRIGEAAVGADESVNGMGPAASKVYRGGKGVSLGGYGELDYVRYGDQDQSGNAAGQTDQLDVHRFILYAGYKFSDRWVLNTEIEFEHVDEVNVEFAYLDYKATDALGVRTGLLLVPMGIINELHEPTTFPSVDRPDVEKSIIPTTWREIGGGLYGELGPLSYRVYGLGGMEAAGFDASGIRGGRQKGAKALAEDFAGVARVDLEPLTGLVVGGSVYYGGSGQDLVVETTGAEPTVGTLVWEGHAMLDIAGLRLRALAAGASISDVAQLNQALGLEGAAGVGSSMFGMYVEGGYDLFSAFGPAEQGLVPFVRYELLNTQAEVAQGYSADPSQDRSILTLGAAWLPHRQITFKVDYQLYMNQAETGVDQLEAGVGFIF